eukprot:scaffold61646_cov62-Phaeocystis_antarctica.AAC.5
MAIAASMLNVADCGPAAYAACQATAAASCAATFGAATAGLGFVPCYAAAQSACASSLLIPEPWCTIL